MGTLKSTGNAIRNARSSDNSAIGTFVGGEYQNVSYTDLVSEGPIWGLVDGAHSVYFDDNPAEEGNYTGFKPKRINAKVTFTGSSTTGTFDVDTRLPVDFSLGEGRELVTAPHTVFNVTITSKTKTDGGFEFEVETNGSTPAPFNFTSAVFDSTSSKDFDRIVALTLLFPNGGIKRVSLQGSLSTLSTSTANFIGSLNGVSSAVFDDIIVGTLNNAGNTTGYITVIEHRKINSINVAQREVVVDGSNPPAQSSLFWITDAATFSAAVTTGTNVDIGLSAASNIGKIDDLMVQENFGTVDQYPLPRIQNVGGSAAVAPSPMPNVPIRMFDYREMSNLLPGHVGLVHQPIQPTHLAPKEGEVVDYDAETDQDPKNFPHGDFGLQSLTQVRQADTIQFDIVYNQGLIYFGGNGTPNYYHMTAMYDVILELYNGTDTLAIINIYDNPALVHRGKRQGPLAFTHEIDISQYRTKFGDFTGFKLYIYRFTRHKGATMKADGTRANKDTEYWQVLAESSITNLGATFQDKFTYPNSALVNVVFSSRQFKTAPKRSYDIRGRLLKVPQTYTPREYSDTGIAKYQGFWDGTFINNVYTDNPAWIFYDIITNDRYGAGTWVDPALMDKYSLYRIAKYCDDLVPASEETNADLFQVDEFYEIKVLSSQTQWNDMARTTGVTYSVGDLVRVLEPGPSGSGAIGVRYEPRFRMNLFLTKPEAVYKVLKDIASAFTSILYWMDGQLTLIQDQPSTSVHTFSKSNVIEGKFEYQTTSAKLRPNQYIVYYNDPTSNYERVPVMYEDPVAIAKNGKVITKSAVAFGCTSESQAIRYAKWKLWTAQNQKEIIIFQTGLQGKFVRPGDIIGVQDRDRQNVTYSGRVSTSTLSTLTFDRQVNFNGNSSYILNVMFSRPAAVYVGYEPVTVNGTTYSKGEYIPEAFIRTSGGAYVLSTLDTEEKASNAFKDTSNNELLPILWKKYTHVKQYEIVNPASAGTFLLADVVTLANSEVFEENVADGSVWSLFETASTGETVLGSEKLYRIMAVTHEDKHLHTIQAVEHSNAKFDAVDTDYELGNIPPSIFPEKEPEVVPPPENARIQPFSDNPALLFSEFQLQWDAPDTIYIAAYEVSATPNLFPDEQTIKTVGDTSLLFKDVPQGKYVFKIRTISPKQNRSPWVSVVLDYEEPTNEDGDPIGVPDQSIERIHGLPVWAHANMQGRILNVSSTPASTTEFYQVTNRYTTGGFSNLPNTLNIAAGDYYVLETSVIATSGTTWKSQQWIWNGVKLETTWQATTSISDTLFKEGETYERGTKREGPTTYVANQGYTVSYEIFALKGEQVEGQEGYEVWALDFPELPGGAGYKIAELASYGSPSSYATITKASGNGVVDLSGIPDGDDRELYIIFDHSIPKLFLGYFDIEVHPDSGATGLWRNITPGNGDLSLTYTAITGTAVLPANSNILTGTNTQFLTDLRVGDFISLANASSAAAIPAPSLAAQVIAIESDTKITLNGVFDTQVTLTNLYRNTYRPDYARDAVIAFVERE